mgnify:CR=1 FL=1
MTTDLHIDDAGVARCPWGVSTPDYVTYHDNEWGEPTTDERTLFEKLCLEGFQAGLSWLTILRKREAFREAFNGFDCETVAALSAADVDRLCDNERIIRNRRKIEATVHNAGKILELEESGGFETWLTGHPSAADRAKALRREFKFLGPAGIPVFLWMVGAEEDATDG